MPGNEALLTPISSQGTALEVRTLQSYLRLLLKAPIRHLKHKVPVASSSLVRDKDIELTADNMAMPLPTNAAQVNAYEVFNYMRPQGQLVLLLQKKQDFPHYPHELSQSIEEKTWYARMDELSKVLHRYWSWVEKTLFAIALLCSATVPWPVIAAVTRYLKPSGEDTFDGAHRGPISDSPSSQTSSVSSSMRTTRVKAEPTSEAVSSTAAALANAASATARFLLKRQSDMQDEDSDNSTWTDSDDLDGFVGDGYWTDNYTDSMRWAAIGVLLGILVSMWLPWIYVTVRNTRALNRLIDSWNDEDEKLGPMRSLEWSLNKAPAFSNAKILIIRLPPGLQQQPSVFHTNAYPPSYGFRPASHSGSNRSSLPGYPTNAEGHWYDDKDGKDQASIMAPPQTVQDHRVAEHDRSSDATVDSIPDRVISPAEGRDVENRAQDGSIEDHAVHSRRFSHTKRSRDRTGRRDSASTVSTQSSARDEHNDHRASFAGVRDGADRYDERRRSHTGSDVAASGARRASRKTSFIDVDQSITGDGRLA